MSALVLPHTDKHFIGIVDHGPRPHTSAVVIHGMEGTLEGALSWWARSQGREHDGAHLAVDDHRAVQVCDLNHKAWHAGAANGFAIGVEHAGFAKWTKDHWLQHENMLKLSANRVAWIHHHYRLGVPHWLKTIYPHYYGGAAWGGHSCPGMNFPFNHYVNLVQKAYRDGWGI